MARRLRRRLIVSLAALSVLAVPPAAEGATVPTLWTIRPDVRDPVLLVGLSGRSRSLSPPVLVDGPTGPVSTADVYWRIVRSTYGRYKLENSLLAGMCLAGYIRDSRYGSQTGSTYLDSCQRPLKRVFVQFNFNRPGGAPTRPVDGGVYQIRGQIIENGEETYGRCLTVRSSIFQAGGKLVMQPCNRGTSSQRFLLKSYIAG